MAGIAHPAVICGAAACSRTHLRFPLPQTPASRSPASQIACTKRRCQAKERPRGATSSGGQVPDLT